MSDVDVVDVEDETPPDVSEDANDGDARVTGNTCRHCGKPFAWSGSRWKHEQKCPKRPHDEPGDAEKPTAPATKGERKPRAPRPRRHSAADILGGIWSQGARFVPSVPAQRAMAWQAPGAGRTLDRALAGSFVDRLVLQRVVGTKDKYAPVISLVSLPLTVMVIDQQPAMLPVLAPQLRAVIKENMIAALEAKAIEDAETAKLQAAAEAAGMEWETTDPETGEKMDIIDALIRDLLAPAEASGEPQEATA